MPPRDKGAADSGDPQTDTTPVADEQPGDTITLAIGHPHDELVLHDVKGADDKPLVITAAGTEVPAANEQAVRDAAKAAGVQIRKVR